RSVREERLDVGDDLRDVRLRLDANRVDPDAGRNAVALERLLELLPVEEQGAVVEVRGARMVDPAHHELPRLVAGPRMQRADDRDALAELPSEVLGDRVPDDAAVPRGEEALLLLVGQPAFGVHRDERIRVDGE